MTQAQLQTYNEGSEIAVQHYQNASLLSITVEEQNKLELPIDETEIEIRPDGLIYFPQVFVRKTLNNTFGIGQWALIQHQVIKEPDSNKLYYDGSLYIRGNFVARAVGEQEYHDSNPMQSWGSAYEGAKSDCLVRCCKDLGIGNELWQPRFIQSWKDKYAVKVFVKVINKKSNKEETKVQWRRKDQEPFWNETGIVSNNKPQNKAENKPNNLGNNTQSKPKQTETPAQNKPKEPNYTEIAESFKTVEELKTWYKSLNKDLQVRLKNLVSHCKEKLESTPINANTIIPNMIRNSETIEDLERVDNLIDSIKDKGQRAEYIDLLQEQTSILKANYTIKSVPF